MLLDFVTLCIRRCSEIQSSHQVRNTSQPSYYPFTVVWLGLDWCSTKSKRILRFMCAEQNNKVFEKGRLNVKAFILVHLWDFFNLWFQSLSLLDIQMLVPRLLLLQKWIALHKNPATIPIALSTHILPVPISSINHSPIHRSLHSCSNSFQPTLHVLPLELGLWDYMNPSPPTSYHLFFLLDHTTHPVKPPKPSISPAPLKAYHSSLFF